MPKKTAELQQEKSEQLPKSHNWRPWGDHPIIITILVFIAIIGILPTVYNWIFESEARIEVKGDASKILLPKPYISDINKQRATVSSTDIYDAFPENTEIKFQLEIAQKISEFLNKDKPDRDDFLNTPERLTQYYELSVTNNGVKEAQDVNLEFPFDGYYEINDTNPENSGQFSKIIKLGNIRPSNTIQVSVWKTDYFSSYLDENIKATYPNGSSKAVFTEKATGIWAWGARNSIFFEAMFYVVSLAIILPLVIIAALNIIYKYSSGKL